MESSFGRSDPEVFSKPGIMKTPDARSLRSSVTDEAVDMSYASGPSGQRQVFIDGDIVSIASSRRKQIKDARWSWCSTAWSALTLWLFCPLCGFLGLVYSVLAYVDYRTGYYAKSNAKRLMAWGWIVVGLIIGVIIIVGAILVFGVFWKEIVAICGDDLKGCFSPPAGNSSSALR